MKNGIPEHLRADGKKFWRQILKDFEIGDAHGRMLLAAACQCIDRMVEARQRIEVDGSYYVDRWQQPKEHPAHKTERDNKILLCRILRELQLDIDPPESRPPSRY